MAWHRIVLALAFAFASILAAGAPHSARMSAQESGMEMKIGADAPAGTSAEMQCVPCTKASSAMPECVSAACGFTGLALPAGLRSNLAYVSAAFDRPADQTVDSPIYSPDPYPPKSLFS